MSYDLERLSALVVDDSSFSRALLSRVLRSLGIRTITGAADGGEAIHILKTMATNPHKSSIKRVDIVLCDWLMSPVDGAMFLKWVRRHRESVDRFMPFIMVSALAEAERVVEARNLGANEFLAKPFSVKSLSGKILNVIDRPRPFVYTRDYFGPDRRRHQQTLTGTDRRIATRESVGIIHAGGKLPSTFPDGIQAYYIRTPNRLKEIVAGLGADAREAGTLDEAVLEAAESEVIAMEADYADWVKETMQKLHAAYEALKGKPKNYWKYYGIINALSHDLRGQGETFGYPLVTDFGKSLYEYTKLNVVPDDRFTELLNAHISAIQAVVRDRIKGNGGETGQIIVTMLDTAKRKWEQQSVA